MTTRAPSLARASCHTLTSIGAWTGLPSSPRALTLSPSRPSTRGEGWAVYCWDHAVRLMEDCHSVRSRSRLTLHASGLVVAVQKCVKPRGQTISGYPSGQPLAGLCLSVDASEISACTCACLHVCMLVGLRRCVALPL